VVLVDVALNERLKTDEEAEGEAHVQRSWSGQSG